MRYPFVSYAVREIRGLELVLTDCKDGTQVSVIDRVSSPSRRLPRRFDFATTHKIVRVLIFGPRQRFV